MSGRCDFIDGFFFGMLVMWLLMMMGR